MDFEELLQKRFGLKGKLRKSDKAVEKLCERYDRERAEGGTCDWWTPEIVFTKKGWAAWEILLDTLDDMVSAGIMTDKERNEIGCRICDIA